MPVMRVEPSEAAQLMARGYRCVDVRSIPEFEAGHPRGAYNIPFMHRGPAGMTPNAAFAAVIARSFDKRDKLLMFCRSGNRSLRAAELLTGQGYTDVIDVRGGWLGEAGPAGQVVVRGWEALALPIAHEAEAGRSYAELADDD